MNAAINKRARSNPERRLFSVSDLLVLFELLLFSSFAIFIPERHWRTWCFWFEWLKWKAGVFSIERILSGRARLSKASEADALKVAASRSEHHTQIMREVTLGWKPDIILIGKENIEKALALGRGAVLWIAHFSFNSLASKKAFSAAGFDVYHVSRPEHGFSKTRFGIKVLNQIRVRAELRSLAGRIGIDRTKPVESMQAALKLLRQNSIVSITAGAWEGQLLIVVEIFGTELQLAAGAPRLAYAAGCPLLPVFTIRPANSRQIHVVVGDAAIMKESRDLFVRTAAESFVSETARFAAANPEQWRGWEKLRN